MQAMIAEDAARGQVDLSLVSVDSTTARAHHHAAGMALDPELAAALEEAAGQEKGLHQRGKSRRTASPPRPPRPVKAETAAALDAGGYNAGAGSG